MTFHNSVLLPEEIAILALVSTNVSTGSLLTIINPHVLSIVSYGFLYETCALLTQGITDSPILLHRRGEGSRCLEA